MTRSHPSSGTVTFDFSDRVAIVTGASRGIGAQIAQSLAEAGARLVVHGHDARALEEQAEKLRSSGTEVRVVVGNIKSPDTAEALVRAATEAFGGLDILVNNAGGNFAMRLEEYSLNAWNATVETNLGGAFLCSRAAWPALSSKGGVIVNIGSTSSNHAHPYRAAYAAAKAGLASLTRTMAVEWAPYGIRVNCVEPGPVLVPASRFADPTTAEHTVAQIPLGRLGTPSDVAGAALFLCSDAASYITGETLVVAGGPKSASHFEDPKPANA